MIQIRGDETKHRHHNHISSIFTTIPSSSFNQSLHIIIFFSIMYIIIFTVAFSQPSFNQSSLAIIADHHLFHHRHHHTINHHLSSSFNPSLLAVILSSSLPSSSSIILSLLFNPSLHIILISIIHCNYLIPSIIPSLHSYTLPLHSTIIPSNPSLHLSLHSLYFIQYFIHHSIDLSLNRNSIALPISFIIPLLDPFSASLYCSIQSITISIVPTSISFTAPIIPLRVLIQWDMDRKCIVSNKRKAYIVLPS